MQCDTRAEENKDKLFFCLISLYIMIINLDFRWFFVDKITRVYYLCFMNVHVYNLALRGGFIVNRRDHFQSILAHTSRSPGFWHGQPHPEAEAELFRYFQVENNLELGIALGSTMHWVWPDDKKIYLDPNGRPMFDVLGGQVRHSLSEDGIFANCESVEEIEAFPWPRLEYLNFESCMQEIHQAHEAGLAVMSGMWCPFFHIVADFFGMENYFVKMYTHPEVVDAVTNKVVDFFIAANTRFLTEAQGKVDLFFFGNDFGCQRDTLISPECFRRFVLPSLARLVENGQRFGLPTALHSCGSIYKVLPDILALGINILHPIQAQATGMSAVELEAKYGEAVVFMGGMDAQGILPFGTPAEVRAEAERLTAVFGGNYILSPSHECLLPNIPPENLTAMADFIRQSSK